MIRIISASSDAYITNRKIRSSDSSESNTGYSGTIDIFKIISDGEIELSRGLIKFDLDDIKNLHNQNRINVDDGSFWAKISLKDVYGGQTTPKGFTLRVNPLARPFDEGVGKDVVLYSDKDVVNFKSASYETPWTTEGCGHPQDDFDGTTEFISQTFETGEEDLFLDVTSFVKDYVNDVSGEVQNHGFRISLSPANEVDTKNYFVKRFSSRHAYSEIKRPTLMIGFDDSIQDKSSKPTLGDTVKFVTKNYVNGDLQNLKNGSGSPLTGPDCIVLKIEGNSGSINISGSQTVIGGITATGVYEADFEFTHAALQELISGSTNILTSSWLDPDGLYLGDTRTLEVSKDGLHNIDTRGNFLDVTVNIPEIISPNVEQNVPVFVFDRSHPYVSKKLFSKSYGNFQGIASDGFYCIRDSNSHNIVIPFDTEKGSTRLSSDAEKLYFELDMSSLPPNRTYYVDIMLIVGGKSVVFKKASPIFKVTESL